MERSFSALPLRRAFLDGQRHVPSVARQRMRPVALHLVTLHRSRPVRLHLIAVERSLGAHLEWADLLLLLIPVGVQMQSCRHHAEVKQRNNAVLGLLKGGLNGDP